MPLRPRQHPATIVTTCSSTVRPPRHRQNRTWTRRKKILPAAPTLGAPIAARHGALAAARNSNPPRLRLLLRGPVSITQRLTSRQLCPPSYYSHYQHYQRPYRARCDYPPAPRIARNTSLASDVRLAGPREVPPPWAITTSKPTIHTPKILASPTSPPRMDQLAQSRPLPSLTRNLIPLRITRPSSSKNGRAAASL
ncbi:uncharacterized protein BKA78DRAFT_452 [Phyllosticta capitalensis]|uniref:uncharacterized protein n=1 Tax=Phyllosticta capitalensis TaxID=121624 RepID=UPI00312DCAB1